MCRCSSSTSPAAKYWLIVLAPPAIATSCPFAAAEARLRAASMPSVKKTNVVPPAIGRSSRAWEVSTKTGWW